MTAFDEKTFFDTNVLAYALDEKEPSKRQRSVELLKQAVVEGKAVVSNQVLAELFWVIRRKFNSPGIMSKALDFIEAASKEEKILKLNYSHKTVNKAARLSLDSSAPFWDALIAQTMLENGVKVIYTENTADFAKIPGLKAINPFE